MQYFEFTDRYGTHRIDWKEAADILGVTRRTIQNYYHSDRREPVKWKLLELYATGRVIPENWDARVKGDSFYTMTGYDIPHWEIDQVAFWHTVKDNTIMGLQEKIEVLSEKLSRQNTAEKEGPSEPVRGAQILPFRRKER